MDLTNYKIVKQSNSKFALWDEIEKVFVFTNIVCHSHIKAHLLGEVEIALKENILDYAQDSTWFKHCLEEYKLKWGLDLTNKSRKAAAEKLKAMGEFVEDV
jgi:hypothetical protein